MNVLHLSPGSAVQSRWWSTSPAITITAESTTHMFMLLSCLKQAFLKSISKRERPFPQTLCLCSNDLACPNNSAQTFPYLLLVKTPQRVSFKAWKCREMCETTARAVSTNNQGIPRNTNDVWALDDAWKLHRSHSSSCRDLHGSSADLAALPGGVKDTKAYQGTANGLCCTQYNTSSQPRQIICIIMYHKYQQ